MQKLRSALCTPCRGLAPGQVPEGEQAQGAGQCPRPWLFSGPVLGVEELGGSPQGMQDIRDSRAPRWPASQCSG